MGGAFKHFLVAHGQWSINVSAVLGLTCGTLMAAGQTDLVPDAAVLSSLPVTALLTLITLASLSIAFYVIKENFRVMKEYAAALSSTAGAINHLTDKLENRPCFVHEKGE